MIKFLRSLTSRFARESGGSVIVEAVIILPALIWAYMALFIYWDAFRYENTATKASYTVADMITREVKDVNDAYISGLKTVFDYLIDADQPTAMVVSSVTWSAARNRFEVLWSEARGSGVAALSTGSLQEYKNQIPRMADGDTVIIMQTFSGYVPLFEVGIPTFTYRQFIVTRPRRAVKISCTTCGIGV